MNCIRGKYIAFCEGDDWWTDDHKLQRQFDIIEKNPGIALSFHAARHFNQQTARFGARIGLGRGVRFIHIRDAIYGSGGNIATCTFFVRRDAYPPMEEWFVNSPIIDYPMKIWVASRGACHYDPRVMSAYRVGLNSSWSGRARSVQEKWELRRRTVDMLLALNRRLAIAEADVAIRAELSRLLRDFLLEIKSAGVGGLEGGARYDLRLRPLDRLLTSAGWRFGISAEIRSCLARFMRYKSAIRSVVS